MAIKIYKTQSKKPKTKPLYITKTANLFYKICVSFVVNLQNIYTF